MKRIILIILFLSFLWMYNASYAAWYGNYSAGYSNPGGSTLTPIVSPPTWPNKWTWCPFWDRLALNNSSSAVTPHGDNEMSVPMSWTMRCIKWDGTIPSAPSITVSPHSHNVWSNNNDPRLKITEVNGGPSPTTTYYCVATHPVTSCTPSILYTSERTFLNVPSWTYYVYARTIDAWWTGPISSYTIRIDTIDPSVWDNYPASYDWVWTKSPWETISLSPSDAWGSWVFETKFCLRAAPTTSCIPDTLYTVPGLIPADYEGVIQYQTWDVAWNMSAIWIINIKLDDSTPNAPTINSSTHIHNVWSNNNDPKVTVTEVNAWPSPAITNYCYDQTNTCTPTTPYAWEVSLWIRPSGTYYFRARTIDTWWTSAISSYTIKIDTINPSSLGISYISWWTNSSKTITVRALDTWGSRLKSIELQQYDRIGGWWTSVTTVANWDNLNATWLVTQTHVRTPVHNHNYHYRIIARDYAWNSHVFLITPEMRFDTVNPTWSVSYIDGWTNNTSQTATFTRGDDLSGVASSTFEVREAADSPNFITWWAWSSPTATSPYSYTAINKRAYQFRMTVRDIAWNQTTYYSSPTLRTTKIDTDIPAPSDLTNTNPIAGSNFPASLSRSISMTPGINGWSPIVKIQWFFENQASVDGYLTSIATVNGPTSYW